MISEMNPLGHFHFYKYRVTLKPKGELFLPPYKGSVLRGLFGWALRRVVCPRKDDCCDGCMVRHGCAYALLMATPIPESHPHAGKYWNPPRPYVIEPPLTGQQYFGPDDLLSFDIVLIGIAGECFPYLVLALVEMGKRSKGRGAFEVLSIDALDLEGKEILRVFKKGDRPVACGQKIEYRDFLAEKGGGSVVTLVFETPLRIKENDRLAMRIPFSLFIRRLSERVLLLSHFYCGADMGDCEDFIRDAGKVEILESQLRWTDWRRYSSRQKVTMCLGGLVGSITYRGDLKKYFPLLRLGEHIHVGKTATFGLGKYRVVVGE